MEITIDKQNLSPRIKKTGTLVYSELTNTLFIKSKNKGVMQIGSSVDTSNFVEKSTTIEINGVAQDLSTNRTWTIFVPTKTSELTNDSGFLTSSDLSSYLTISSAASTYQPILVSGTTIKTINGISILGSGNISVSSSPVLTTGSIPFSNGSTLTEDNSNLFWDNTNKRLGVGTNSPAYTIDTGTTARAKIGRMILGAWSVNTSYAFFGSSGFDQTVAGNYGLIQGSDGTFINTPTGGNLGFRRNNGNLISLPSAGGIQMFQGVGITNISGIPVNTSRELSLTQANNNPNMAFIRWDLTTFDTDVLGRIQFNSELSAGGSGTERNAAYIEAQAAGTFSSTNSPGRLVFYTTPVSSTTPSARMNINSDGNVRIGTGNGSAYLHIKAGTATAGSAPLKFTSGTNLTTPEAGVVEYNNTFHLTNSDATRRHIVLAPNTTKVTTGAPNTNDGYVIVNIGGIDFKLMTCL